MDVPNSVFLEIRQDTDLNIITLKKEAMILHKFGELRACLSGTLPRSSMALFCEFASPFDTRDPAKRARRVSRFAAVKITDAISSCALFQRAD